MSATAGFCKKCRKLTLGGEEVCKCNKSEKSKKFILDHHVLKELYLLLPLDERELFLSSICKYCGDANPGCQCWNDE